MKQLGLSAVMLAALACALPTSVCGCPPFPPGVAAVYGTVTRGGSPVADAEVRIGRRQPRCGNALVTLMPVATTDAVGAYRYVLQGSADSACIRVVARGPEGAAGDSAVVDRVRLQLTSGGYTLTPTDSVRVDLVLPGGS